jgi:hypothetical protein
MTGAVIWAGLISDRYKNPKSTVLTTANIANAVELPSRVLFLHWLNYMD